MTSAEARMNQTTLLDKIEARVPPVIYTAEIQALRGYAAVIESEFSGVKKRATNAIENLGCADACDGGRGLMYYNEAITLIKTIFKGEIE